ncbi:hypothetical protein MXEN_12536 [Mycobacterium xenopi RIVM700367]|uniref:Uncharacterized protein n=1 Tax=Mycobacterium xenopi 4042 TaxID=1299334 RepID=X8CK18_MYCXE|nr:hypothetical protein MXEN_12536 [Mycobacterium xenopi RIVM700367]EUA43406.1 hypothetical protein I552_8147 [Mycobacterium xenopi 3993]EUA56444.1 hypothetical protein I553_8492 [Mycobacterium xenopi 4042]
MSEVTNRRFSSAISAALDPLNHRITASRARQALGTVAHRSGIFRDLLGNWSAARLVDDTPSLRC